jgi:hypothetical protein
VIHAEATLYLSLLNPLEWQLALEAAYVELQMELLGGWEALVEVNEVENVFVKPANCQAVTETSAVMWALGRAVRVDPNLTAPGFNA